jgi:hypothetical protein
MVSNNKVVYYSQNRQTRETVRLIQQIGFGVERVPMYKISKALQEAWRFGDFFQSIPKSDPLVIEKQKCRSHLA